MMRGALSRRLDRGDVYCPVDLTKRGPSGPRFGEVRGEQQLPRTPLGPELVSDVGVVPNSWGDYGQMSPDARPMGAQEFRASGSYTSTDANKGSWTTVAQFVCAEGREGRVLKAAGAEILGGGDDVSWRWLIEGDLLVDIPAWQGVWASLDTPEDLCLGFPRGARIELQASIPTKNRTVQAYFKGWTAPLTRLQGRVSAGFQPTG